LEEKVYYIYVGEQS
jgi:hypothetical protein